MASSGDKSSSCPGLFYDRKPHQVFNEVWRIPINDIDRPGSFATYCCKSLMLLLDVLKSKQDIQTLADIALQLRKYPTGGILSRNHIDILSTVVYFLQYL